MEEGLYDYLVAQTAVTDIVGTRIYQVNAPQGAALPLIEHVTLQVEEYTHSTAGSGLAKTTIRIDCYDDSYDGVKTLAAAVRGELHGFGNGSMGSQFVRSCFLTGTRDTHSAPTDASEVPVYGVSMDFEFMHPVSVPSYG